MAKRRRLNKAARDHEAAAYIDANPLAALDPRELEFCRLVLSGPGMPLGRAYQMAGYAVKDPSNASRLGRIKYHQIHILRAIGHLRQDAARELQITTADVLYGLHREALGQGPGNGRPDKTTAAARVRAWELIGRHLRMFVDRPPAETIEAGQTFNLDALSHDERVTFLEFLDKISAHGGPAPESPGSDGAENVPGQFPAILPAGVAGDAAG